MSDDCRPWLPSNYPYYHWVQHFISHKYIYSSLSLRKLTLFHHRRSSQPFSSLSSSLDSKRHRGRFPGKSPLEPFHIEIFYFVNISNNKNKNKQQHFCSPICEICNHFLAQIASLSSYDSSELKRLKWIILVKKVYWNCATLRKMTASLCCQILSENLACKNARHIFV